MKKLAEQIQFWTHMLDESKHVSVYQMYMMENPKDKLPTLIDNLIGQFAKDLKKDGLKLENCLKDGYVNDGLIDRLQSKVKTKYYWHRIKAREYTAIISRFVALSDRAKGQKFNEDDEITYDDVAHGVSRKKLEDCLSIVCHNVNVLEANNCIVNSLESMRSLSNFAQVKLIVDMKKHVDAAFANHGIPKTQRYDSWYDKDVEDYFAAIKLYEVWGSYGKGRAREQYVCDSNNGPGDLKKVLDAVEFSADDVDLLVALNKALDVVHFRSDLAAAFIEGGQRTCATVSNLPNRFVV